jgi:CRP-like cAMP-binding protein
MNTEVILSHINEYISLDEAEAAFLSASLIPRSMKAGELIVESGEPARYMIFVNAGYLMTYYTDNEGLDHVVQFASTGWWSGDLFSLKENTPTIYSTRALSAGEVLLFPKAAQDQILEKYPKFERYFRILFHNALVRLQFRIIENYSATAEARYLSFRTRFPNMEQHVSQKHIASYLGITPEFLSKIRRKLQQQS